MAQMEVNFYSNSLMRTATVNVIIPTDKRTNLGQLAAPAKFPVLYLLHGILGNYTDWISGTTVQSLADTYNLCVVMPSGDNKFYVDSTKTGDLYGTFISEELPDFIERTFPVYTDREHTFLAGLSMGGFGTVVNGLKHPEKFGYLGMFSAALIKNNIINSRNTNVQDLLTKKNYETMLDLKNAKDYEGSVNDYEALAEKLASSGDAKPKVWIACGTEDSLYPANEVFAKKLKELGYSVKWSKWKGKHDWIFWQECIVKFIPWLPLGQGEAGKSSGNVGV